LRCIGSRGPIEDPDGAWASTAQLTATGALLVRPDGFIAARFDTAPSDAASALRDVLSTVLDLHPALSHDQRGAQG
jgi:2,4-dichlorophenol 6-monooxygenase